MSIDIERHDTHAAGESVWAAPGLVPLVQGLLEAEARNITQATASTFPAIAYGDQQYSNMIIRAVSSIGNFADVYEETIGVEIPRTGLNLLRTGACEDGKGLIYGVPFGGALRDDPLAEGRGKVLETFCFFRQFLGDFVQFVTPIDFLGGFRSSASDFEFRKLFAEGSNLIH